MSIKQELLEAFKRILWLEKEMQANYAQYAVHIQNQNILKVLREIGDDEKRHINMAERMISILRF